MELCLEAGGDSLGTEGDSASEPRLPRLDLVS